MTFEVPALAAGFASKFDEIGPYIGFGSLVAVVAMAVLVFAQGRELQRLREWAGSSPERLDALEQEFQAAAQRGARPPVPARPGFVAPTAAGIGAPGAPPAPPGVAGAPGTVPSAPGSPVVGAGSATPPGVPVAGAPRPTPPRPAGILGDPATRVVPAASSLGGPRAATAAGAAASTARERDREGASTQRSIGQIVGVSVVGVIVLLALLFAFGVIGGSSGSPGDDAKAPGSSATPTTTAKTAAPRYPKTEMKTVVLNASGSSGLAGTVSDSIDQELRFPMGKPSNYTVNGASMNEPTTVVQYKASTGQTLTQNRRAAQDLATYLKKTVPGVKVQRMTDNVALLAPDQRLVVLVGQDYAAKVPGTSGGGTAGTSTGTGGTTTSGGAAGTSGAAGAATGATTGATTSATTTPSTGLGTTDGGVDGTSDTGGTTLP